MNQHPPTTPLGKAEAKAAEINAKLSAYDFKPHEHVRVETDEGCLFILASAFILKYGEWYLVFAEHHVPKVFHKDDVTKICKYHVIEQHKFKDADKFRPKKY